MIIKLLENTITGPIVYRIFSFILILLIFFWVIWGVKISKKENLSFVPPEVEEKKKSYAKIDFVHANSTACLINTNRKELENKLCILLYRITFVRFTIVILHFIAVPPTVIKSSFFKRTGDLIAFPLRYVPFVLLRSIR